LDLIRREPAVQIASVAAFAFYCTLPDWNQGAPKSASNASPALSIEVASNALSHGEGPGDPSENA
jgi:hypothetical protein